MSWSDWKAFASDRIKRVPEESGVYRLDNRSETLYIGKTDNLNRRLMEHLNSDDLCIKKVTVFTYMVTESPEQTEKALLEEYTKSHGKLPECNEKIG